MKELASEESFGYQIDTAMDGDIVQCGATYWMGNSMDFRFSVHRRKASLAACCAAVVTLSGGLGFSQQAIAKIKDGGKVTVNGTAPTCSGVWVGNNESGYDCLDASWFFGGGGGYSGTFDSGGGAGGTTDSQLGADKQADTTAPVKCPEGEGAGTGGTTVSGKPVIIATGAKVLPEVDFVIPPDAFPLKVTRLYDKNLTRAGIFGPRWSSNLDINLTFEYGAVQCTGSLSSVSTCNPGGNPLSKIYLNGETGYGTPFTLVGGVWTDEHGNTLTQSGSNWMFTSESGLITTFDGHGRPLTVKDERGIGLTYAYNGSNQLATVTHSSGRSISFTWSGSKVVAIVAPNGSAYGYGYNGNGHLASVVYPGNLGTRTYHYEAGSHPGGLTGISINSVRYSRYSYHADGRVYQSGLEGGIERSTFAYAANYTEVTNALGHKVHYEYAAVGGKRRLIWTESDGSLSCTGSIVSTTYDTNGNRDIEADHFNVKTDYDFDGDDRLVQKISGIGPSGQTDQQQITQFVWDPTRKSRLNQIKVYGTSTAQPLSTTTYTYYPDGDARARLLQSVVITNHGGGSVGTLTTSYNYTVHSNGLVASMTVDGPLSGAGDAVTSTYDASGNLLTVKNSLNHTTTFANYNSLGQPGTVTSANGGVVAYTYNVRGQVLTKTQTVNGAAQVTTTAYDNRGRRVSVTMPDAVAVNYEYDSYDRITKVSKARLPNIFSEPLTADGVVFDQEQYTYNLLSQVTRMDKGIWYKVALFFEQQCSPYPECAPYTFTLQSRATLEYDIAGFLSKRKGEHGQTLTYSYNANGDVSQVQDALSNKTIYTYDRHRRVSIVKDANNKETLLSYSPLGLTTLVRDARGNDTSYVYDGFGNLLSQTSPDTGLTTFAYNAQGQRTQAQRADLTTVAYTYDTLGRMKTQSAGGQTRTLTYDTCANGKGMLCTAVKSGGSTTTASFTYTPWGNVATRQDVLGSATDTTAYSYDGMHRLAGISYPSGISVGYGYSGGSPTATTATINGTTTTLAIQAGFQGGGVPAHTMFWNGLTRQVNYDSDGRAAGISVKDYSNNVLQSLTYGFDNSDRITTITNGVDSGLTQNYGYSNVSRLTSAALAGGNTESFGYDDVGNRSSQSNTSPANSTSYTIAGLSNRLTQSVTGALTRTYTHNSNGNITAFTNSVGVANTLTYDPFGRLASHIKAGVTTAYTVNALDQRVSKSNSSSTSRYVNAGFNQLLAEHTNGVWTSYIWSSGEPIAMVRNNQIYYLHNDHLGRPQLATDSNMAVVWKATNLAFDRTVTTNSIGGINLGFPGQYQDTESGIWHNGYREYLADSGRYLQSDPIGLDGGPNTYSYVSGNPISMIDYLGLTQCDIDAAFAFAQQANPDLKFGNGAPKPDIPRGGVEGQAQLRGGDGYIHLNERYLDVLDWSGVYNLLDTIIHEGMHFTRPINLQEESNNYDHDYISPEATRRAREQVHKFNEDRKSQCGGCSQ